MIWYINTLLAILRFYKIYIAICTLKSLVRFLRNMILTRFLMYIFEYAGSIINKKHWFREIYNAKVKLYRCIYMSNICSAKSRCRFYIKNFAPPELHHTVNRNEAFIHLFSLGLIAICMMMSWDRNFYIKIAYDFKLNFSSLNFTQITMESL